jgi:hypothetical protein
MYTTMEIKWPLIIGEEAQIFLGSLTTTRDLGICMFKQLNDHPKLMIRLLNFWILNFGSGFFRLFTCWNEHRMKISRINYSHRGAGRNLLTQIRSALIICMLGVSK